MTATKTETDENKKYQETVNYTLPYLSRQTIRRRLRIAFALIYFNFKKTARENKKVYYSSKMMGAIENSFIAYQEPLNSTIFHARKTVNKCIIATHTFPYDVLQNPTANGKVITA